MRSPSPVLRLKRRQTRPTEAQINPYQATLTRHQAKAFLALQGAVFLFSLLLSILVCWPFGYFPTAGLLLAPLTGVGAFTITFQLVRYHRQT